ncbi:MAG TPA: 23S rRNA (guanosine(2251)-2'-O)-methyltransferase RlmB [Kofleriaceae bacterium]|nr:23S rRNA (guanosine(2251)-2'-O)-methyltransferase RlmB [Kofleriaceae bacterium]
MTNGGGRRIVFGVGPVRELLRSSRTDVSGVWLSRSRAEQGDRRADGRDPLAELVDLAERRGIETSRHDPAELDAIAGPGAHHQGVVAIAGTYRYAEIEDLIDLSAAAGSNGLLVALDGVTDPHNLGAIARSAHVLGAQGLIMPRDRAAAVSPAVTKASAGATEHLAMAQVTNLARALGQLKEAGLWTAALDAGPRSRPLAELDASVPLCLVVGAEGRGIRPLVARSCDFQLEIPMRGSAVGSLNVSVAAGIALYEVARQRGARTPED